MKLDYDDFFWGYCFDRRNVFILWGYCFDRREKMTWQYDRKFELTRFDELFDLFDKEDELDSEARSFLHEQIDESKKAMSIILLNDKKREAKASLWEYKEVKPEEINVEDFIDLDYSKAIVVLVKWDRIIINNELEDILTEDQFLVWHLRDVYGLSYARIGEIREQYERSSNESTIRDIYKKSRKKMRKVLEICDKYSEILRGVDGVK